MDKFQWQPVGPELIPGPKFCPTAIDDYLRSTRSRNKTSDAVLTSFRQHLLYLDWKIERRVDSSKIPRYRYSSPSHGSFYSLNQVCRSILGIPPITAQSPPTQSETPPVALDPTPPENPGKFSKLTTPSDVIEPMYCPEAVHTYSSLNPGVNRRPFTVKVKQHLSAIGWSFYYTVKATDREELRYLSPCGKVFPNLLAACKWCVATGNNEKGSVSRKRNRDEVVQVSKKHKLKQKSQRVQEALTPSYNRNPRTVLSLLIDNGVVLPSAKVVYRNKNGQTLRDGIVVREGIECNCCGEIFTLTNFEAHAGSSNHRPSEYTFLEDGRSLMDCKKQLKQRITENVGTSELINDDECSLCHYGGELVLCDQCPSSYHTHCIGLEEVPDGDWFCPSCCCRICGRGQKNGKEAIDNSVLTCTQCQNKYHAECHKIEGRKKCYPEGYWFCQDTCEQIFCGLHEILGKPFVRDSLTWTLLKHVKHNSCDEGYILGKLKVALRVMHDCFDPIQQAATGRDLVEGVIFSKWSELNRGFYTVLLEKNKEPISVAIVRIHGKRVAEVPLVATLENHRKKGMCWVLMDELETKLVDLGVESLVLPAVPNKLDTWTNSYGFSVMNERDRLKFLDCNFLDFPGTMLCHKVLKRKPRRYPANLLVYSKRSKLTGGTNRKTQCNTP